MILTMNIMISVYLLIIKAVAIINGEASLKVSRIPDFPFSADKNFTIQITDVEDGKKLSGSPYYSVIIQISNDTNKEKALFDYVYKEMIDQEYKSTFMRIPSWQKSADQLSLTANVIFNRLANSKTLEIFQVIAKTYRERKSKLDSLHLEKPFFQSKIQLLIDPKLDLFIESRDGRKGELMLDEWDTATCRAYDGVPPVIPLWVNHDEFSVRNPIFIKDRNEKKIEISATALDHLKDLTCKAGKTIKSVKINVLHHPSQITMDPEIGSVVENGTTVVCSSIDGYPIPEVRWHFIMGPVNSDKYYTISKDGKQLHLKSETPFGTEWKFNCTATNILPRSHGIFNRTVGFVIGRQQEGLFGLNLTFQIMVGVAVMGAIIIFCIVIVFIVCMARRGCVDHTASRNNRHWVPVKTPTEKKTLEAEQVTLLPPGAPQNHLDISNTGSGLPPPPPEYQLIIDNEVKPVIPLEQQVPNDAYAEVTYAELNTSDLPMKENKGHKANSNDDQVIYSQIIGTISTPDCAQRSYLNPDNV